MTLPCAICAALIFLALMLDDDPRVPVWVRLFLAVAFGSCFPLAAAELARALIIRP